MSGLAPIPDNLPVLTEVIEPGPALIDQALNSDDNWRYDVLMAQLPNLLEQAFFKIKPQLMAELNILVKNALNEQQPPKPEE